MTIGINICYTGKFGVVTDLGQSMELTGWPTNPVGSVGLLIPRYGVWKVIPHKHKHEVVFTTEDLTEAMACADRDDASVEFFKKMRMLEHGGEACVKCGREDYEQNMITVEGRIYCEDCAPADFQHIARLLHAIHPEAEVVATGGGIDCIRVLVGHYALYFGTSGANWGACAYTIVAGGSEDFGTMLPESESNLWTECSSDEPDASKVAAAINACTDVFYSKHYVKQQ